MEITVKFNSWISLIIRNWLKLTMNLSLDHRNENRKWESCQVVITLAQRYKINCRLFHKATLFCSFLSILFIAQLLFEGVTAFVTLFWFQFSSEGLLFVQKWPGCKESLHFSLTIFFIIRHFSIIIINKS